MPLLQGDTVAEQREETAQDLSHDPSFAFRNQLVPGLPAWIDAKAAELKAKGARQLHVWLIWLNG